MEEEELRLIEFKKKNEIANKKGEEKKRKRQMSLEKKKNKEKSKTEKLKVQDQTKKERKDIKNIDRKYKSLFSEAGLDIDNHAICRVKGDGACGCSCAGLNFHHDETLGPYVRGNVNIWIFCVRIGDQLGSGWRTMISKL